MLLCNLYTAKENRKVDIRIGGNLMHEVGDIAVRNGEERLKFEDAIIFPGLINSHDHLDFNLFPALGNRIYKNYVEWGDDIHTQNKEAINAVLKVPQPLRTQWGVYKNLLCGVTTVVNHGPKLSVPNDLISIHQESNVIHSLQLEKGWRLKLNHPLKGHLPVAIHIGEGTDEAAHNEINDLIRWNILRRDLIGIHAVAMDAKQAKSFKALVWCPLSNFFLLGSTADIAALKKQTQILFGTDSTVSAGWDIWEHLRFAREQKMLTDAELYDALTVKAAEVWKLNSAGEIAEGYEADLVVARANGTKGLDAFFGIKPEDILLVVSKGHIRLFDSSLYENLVSCCPDPRQFSAVHLKGSTKYIKGDLPGLIDRIKEYYPAAAMPVN